MLICYVLVSVSLDLNTSIDNERSLGLLSIMSSLIVSRVSVFYERLPFLHDLYLNVNQRQCITDITRADGLPLLCHYFLISLYEGMWVWSMWV